MPPEAEADIEEMDDKSANHVVDDADASKEAEKPAVAESSAAKDDKEAEGEDALSIVRDVVDKREKPAAASSAETVETGAKALTAPKEQDNENYSDVPFNKHPRFQHLLTDLKTARVDQQRYQNVERFIGEHGLSAEEAADLLVIGGLMKTNPAEAWRRMQPTVQKVLVAAGEVLPPELKQRVTAGEMTAEAALQLSRAQADFQSLKARQQFEAEQARSRDSQAALTGIQGAVNNWEADRRLRDPNFDAKMPALEREVAWLQTKEGRPNTPDAVKLQLQKAYDTVSTAFTPPAPRQAARPPIRPVSGGRANGSVRPEIKSTLDLVNAEIAKRRTA